MNQCQRSTWETCHTRKHFLSSIKWIHLVAVDPEEEDPLYRYEPGLKRALHSNYVGALPDGDCVWP